MRYVPIAHLANVQGHEVWLSRLRGAEGFDRPLALLRALTPAAGAALRVASRLAVAEHAHVLRVIELVRADDALILSQELPVALSVRGVAHAIESSGGQLPWTLASRLASDLARGISVVRRLVGTGPDEAAGLVESSLVTEHGLGIVTGIPRGGESEDLRALADWLDRRLAQDESPPSALRDVLLRARADTTQRRMTTSSFADALDVIALSRGASAAELARLLAAEVGDVFVRLRQAREAPPVLRDDQHPSSFAEAIDRLAGVPPHDDTLTLGDRTEVDPRRP